MDLRSAAGTIVNYAQGNQFLFSYTNKPLIFDGYV